MGAWVGGSGARRDRRGGPRGRRRGACRGRADGGRRRDEAGRRGDGRRPHRADPHQAQPGRRLRLPGLRLARPRPRAPARGGVLRERRQGGRRGGHPAIASTGVLRPALDRGSARTHRLLARPPGPAHRADGAPQGRHPLRADRLGRRLRADRRPAAQPRLARRGDLLHLRQDLQRGGVRLSAVRPRVRHQQPPRLLQHVPRVLRGRAGRGDRDRQGLGQPRGHPRRRADRGHGPEPRHQPPADALCAREGQAQRRQDHRDQPARGGRAGPVQEPADTSRPDRARAPAWPTCTCRFGSTATSRCSRRSDRCWSSGTRSTTTSSNATATGSRSGRRTCASSTGTPYDARPGWSAT